MEDRFLKRLRKKARKGMRGWPIATIAFYGPNLSQATKVAVGIVPSENAGVKELRDWKVDRGDIRADPGIARDEHAAGVPGWEGSYQRRRAVELDAALAGGLGPGELAGVPFDEGFGFRRDVEVLVEAGVRLADLGVSELDE